MTTMVANLGEKLRRQQFVVTAEIVPQLSGSPSRVLDDARLLQGQIDAINVTDGAGARSAMSGTIAACLLANDGHEPILQLTCRDRNRLALTGDLLGAAAFGIRNVLVLGGDDPTVGDQPDAKGVFDLSTMELIQLVQRINADGELPNGRKVADPPGFLIGAADVPGDPASGYDPARLEAKVQAGARFVQTQIVFDVDRVTSYLDCLRACGILDQASVIVGIGIAKSLQSARWMDTNLFGIDVPESVMTRLAAADDERQEGILIAADLVRHLAEVPGVAGVHLMAPGGTSESVVQTVALAGIRSPQPASAG